jgi:hypothetical protein
VKTADILSWPTLLESSNKHTYFRINPLAQLSFLITKYPQSPPSIYGTDPIHSHTHEKWYRRPSTPPFHSNPSHPSPQTLLLNFLKQKRGFPSLAHPISLPPYTFSLLFVSLSPLNSKKSKTPPTTEGNTPSEKIISSPPFNPDPLFKTSRSEVGEKNKKIATTPIPNFKALVIQKAKVDC